LHASGKMANQGCQLFANSHHVLRIWPSRPVANRSRCVLLLVHAAATGCPGAAIAVSGRIANHGCQVLAASHHVLMIRPSRPVTNRSRCVLLFVQTAATG